MKNFFKYLVEWIEKDEEYKYNCRAFLGIEPFNFPFRRILLFVVDYTAYNFIERYKKINIR